MREDTNGTLTHNGRYTDFAPLPVMETTVEEVPLTQNTAMDELSADEFEPQEYEETMKVDAAVAKKARMLVKAAAKNEDDEADMTMPSPAVESEEQSPQSSQQSIEDANSTFPVPVETPRPVSPLDTAVSVPAVKQPQKLSKKNKAVMSPRVRRDMTVAHQVQEQCRQLCISLFLRKQSPVRSLGFTSAIRGEGKSFLSAIAARELAKDSRDPVTLLECNWDNPGFHDYFHLPQTPGLAEWLRGECSEMAIRHEVDQNLTVIPAGNGRRDAVKLVQQIQQQHLHSLFASANELLIVDLPPVMASAYGMLAASLVESLVIVVRAGVTPGHVVVETCTQLKDAAVYGLLLNQVQSQVPAWMRQME